MTKRIVSSDIILIDCNACLFLTEPSYISNQCHAYWYWSRLFKTWKYTTTNIAIRNYSHYKLEFKLIEHLPF